MVQILKKLKIQDSSPQLKFFTSFSMFCKLGINLASQATSFMKQIPLWRLAAILILAWINSICLFSSCCGQLCWKNWCFNVVRKEENYFRMQWSLREEESTWVITREPSRHRVYNRSGLLRKRREGTLSRYFFWFQILQS